MINMILKLFGYRLINVKDEDRYVVACMACCDVVSKRSTWGAINPVIRDLEKLRADTWNQEAITKIQTWLKDNFEFPSKKCEK